jgi:Bacterial Ig domain
MKRHAPHNSFRPTQVRTKAAPRKKSTAVLLAVGLALLIAQTRGAAIPNPDPLSYDRGFLITGNYVVGGVDMTSQDNPADPNGLATGQIRFNSTIGNEVPDDADIVGAYLYWEAIYAPTAQPTAGVKFRGLEVDPAIGPTNPPTVGFDPVDPDHHVAGLRARTLLTIPGHTATCWGSASSQTARLTMFRFDVLHLLPKLYDSRGVWTGKLLVNDDDLASNADLGGNAYPLHTVTLPEKTGNSAIQSAGATLVVIYRKASEPLTKIVLYEEDDPTNVYTLATTDTLSQTLRGFYQHTGTSGKLALIGGSGGNNQTERVFFNRATNSQPVLVNAFPQTSPSSDRSWAFSSVPVSMAGTTSAAGYGGTAVVEVDHTNQNQNDCLAFAAIVFSTAVKDDDHDGLPDAVEDSSTVPAVDGVAWKDPDDQLLPDLHAMQASSGHKDMFVEIGAMEATTTITHGSAAAPYDSSATPILEGVPVPAHDHMPLPEVLKMVGDAYKNAPITNTDNTTGIRVHFDVGPALAASYKSQIEALPPPPGGFPPDAYIVQAQPRGGESILETKCVQSDPTDPTCHFPDFAGVVGWPFGYQLLRDAPVGDAGQELTTLTQIETWQAVAGNCGTQQDPISCTQRRRRFDPERVPLFHYILYAHARGKPKALPCLKNGLPAGYPAGTSCSPLAANPAFQLQPLDYHVPSSTSGVAHLPGGNVLVTLGLWDKVSGTGTVYAQAATTFHELGHNLDLWHGGRPADFGQKGIGQAPGTATYTEPNCKPNYQSTMSYLFQVHGLFDENFQQRLDYSRTAHDNLDETAGLNEGALDTVYQPTWFAPANSNLAKLLWGDPAPPAKRLCNGVKFPELFQQQTQPPVPTIEMARVWATSLSNSNDWNVPFDWNGNQVANDSGLTLNVNFDGEFGLTETLTPTTARPNDPLYGFDDWAAVRLDQIGAGRKVAKFTTGVTSEASGDNDPFDGDNDPFDGDNDPFDGDNDPFDGDTDPFDGDNDPFDGDSDPFEGDTDPLEGTIDPQSGDNDPFDGAELDFTAAKLMGRPAPSAFNVCVLGGTPGPPSEGGQNGCEGPWVDNNGVQHTLQPTSTNADSAFFHRNYATWTAPTFGNVAQSRVFRQKTKITSLNQATSFPVVPGGRTSWVDMEHLPAAQFEYAVRAEFDEDQGQGNFPVSGLSNFVTITAVNDWPVGVANSYSVRQNRLLNPAAPGVLGNDTDTDSPTSSFVAEVVAEPSPASAVQSFLLNPNGSFSFRSNNSTAGTIVTFTYRVSNGTWSGDKTTAMNAPDPPATSLVTVTITITN